MKKTSLHWTQAARVASPTRIAIFLNSLIAALVVAGVLLHLMDHHEQALQSVQTRAANMARAQALLIGDQVQNFEFVLSQLATQLNVVRTLAAKTEDIHQRATRVHDLLRQFLNILPQSVDILLVRDDGHVISASNVLAEQEPLQGYCAPLLRANSATAATLQAFRETPVGRCPPQGTLIFKKILTHTTAAPQETLWLLINPTLFQRALARELPQLSATHNFRIIGADNALLIAKEDTHTSLQALPYPPALQTPNETDDTVSTHWRDTQTGQLIAGVSHHVTGTRLKVQIAYAAQEAIRPDWTPYAWLWSGVGLLFLVIWMLTSTLIVRLLKRHQQTLHVKEERFDRSLDFAELGVWEWDIKTDALYWSKRVAPMFGYTEPSLESTNAAFLAAIHPDDRARVSQTIRQCLEDGKRYSVEHRVVWQDGSVRWLRETGNALRAHDGTPTKMMGVVQDITEQHASEQQLRLLETAVSRLNDIVVITEAEPLGESNPRIVFVNDAFERITGYPREEVLGKTPRVLQGPKTQRAQLDRVRAALARWEPIRAEVINYTKSGQEFWLELDIQPIADASGWYTHWVAVERDISERKAMEQQLAETARHTQLILDNVVDAIITIDRRGLIASFNRAATHIFGYTADEIVGQNVSLLMPQPYRDEHDSYLHNYQTTGLKRVIGIGREVQGQHKRGHLFPLNIAISEIEKDGQPMYIGLVRDITQLKEAQARIERLAFFDPLTDLPNRRLLIDRMERALATGARSHQLGALIFIDLDDFKNLNDTWGHETGDQMLRQVGAKLVRIVRECDTVARLGGDEFVLMLENLGTDQDTAATHAASVATQLLAAFTHPFDVNGRDHHSTPSLGITLFGDEPTSADELMRRADAAMYQAKADGRNTYHFFDAKLQAVLTTRAALDEDLRQSLVRGELHLNYQPQADSDDRMIGAEALVRWIHPVRGPVSPAEFIPLAEHSGFILALGQWVLQTACQQLAQWAASPRTADLTMSVNVSARQFGQADFADQVMQALAQSGANPARLKLELTESMLATDVDSIIEKMSLLKAEGVGFSLDDFGTGYSSLSYLKRLPLDQLKIDQSFVRDVLTDPNDAVIVRTIVALGQSMGLAVIAEGVETAGQREFLERNGCHAFQGYLFSRPLNADQLARYLEAAPRAPT